MHIKPVSSQAFLPDVHLYHVLYQRPLFGVVA